MRRAALGLLGCLLLANAAAGPQPGPGSQPGTAVFLAPDGAGRRDGADWDNAGSLSDLARLAGPSARVWLRADLGPYRVSRPIEIRAGGLPGRPTTIAGVDAAGRPGTAILLGDRADPYDPKGAPGPEAFRLLAGASHLRFTDIACRNVGHCFRLGGDIGDIAIVRAEAWNVRRFVENDGPEGGGTATVSGLTIRDVRIGGFSKDAIRLRYDTHDVLIEDVLGDSERQDRDDFAEGVSLDGTAHDVVLRRVTMRNAHDSAGAFWNGDGFATERGTYRIRFEDTAALGSTDAGYDLKSADTDLVRAHAADNKVNFKLWGRGIRLQDCTGIAPFRRGGSGRQAQVEVEAGTDATMTGCSLVDSDPATTVLSVDEGATLALAGTRIVHHPRATLSRVAPGGTLAVEP